MEQNRTLMVIVTVSIFLAAVFGVGMALLGPGDGDGTTAGAGIVEAPFDPVEYVRPDTTEPTPDDPEPEDDPLVIVFGDPDDGETAPAIAVTPDGTDADESIELPARTVAPAPVISVPEDEAAPPIAGPAATTSRTVAATPPVEPSAVAAARSTEYWIQLIASPSRDRVDLANARLEEFSIGGRITTRTDDATTWFRLRVGPYAEREEAEKFLEWIRADAAFGDAYISEEYPVVRTDT